MLALPVRRGAELPVPGLDHLPWMMQVSGDLGSPWHRSASGQAQAAPAVQSCTARPGSGQGRLWGWQERGCCCPMLALLPDCILPQPPGSSWFSQLGQGLLWELGAAARPDSSASTCPSSPALREGYPRLAVLSLCVPERLC